MIIYNEIVIVSLFTRVDKFRCNCEKYTRKQRIAVESEAFSVS